MVVKTLVRTGMIAAEVLETVCHNPAMAYAHAITKVLKKKYGPKHTHDLEVSNALQLLVEDGALQALIPVRGPNSSVPRKMFAPTWKAGLYLGLQGAKVNRAIKKVA